MKPRSFDEFEPEGKRVLVRVDFNSPIDPATGRLLDDKRIRGHLETLRELRRASVALITHQSRPGKNDFTTLEGHAERLDRHLGRDVEYVEDVFGPGARDAITGMNEGDVLLLENARFYSEEYIEMSPEEAAETHMVEKLSPLFDAYVNDAFSAAHRSQPSLVGFPRRLPSYAGRLMERELDVLGGVSESEEPRVFALGGAKAADGIEVVRNVLGGDDDVKVLLSGVLGNIFLAAEGYDLGDPTHDFLENEGYGGLVEKAEEILNEYDSVETPNDVAAEIDGERVEVDVDELPVDARASDIGIETVAEYSRTLREAGTAVVNGPPGVFENELFERGTYELLSASVEANTSIAGGGDTAAAIDTFDVTGFDHVSSGGGASTAMLSGKELPGVEALDPQTDG